MHKYSYLYASEQRTVHILYDPVKSVSYYGSELEPVAKRHQLPGSDILELIKHSGGEQLIEVISGSCQSVHYLCICQEKIGNAKFHSSSYHQVM